MKKLVLLIAIIAIGTSSFAQDVKYGVKGGLNIANFSGDDADGDARTDIYLGGFMRIGLTETLDFQPELVYSRQGSKDKEDGIKSKLKSNYLNVPLLLRAKMFGTENFNAVFGPQVGIHLNTEASQDNGDIEVSSDINDSMSSLDFALAFGLEYDITEKISIGARYNLGLSKIIDEDFDVKNSVFQIGASFAF